MNKQTIIHYLTRLEEFSNLKDDIRKARQECFKQKWDQLTLEKIEWGISLFHNKPSMLNDYINEIKEDKNYE